MKESETPKSPGNVSYDGSASACTLVVHDDDLSVDSNYEDPEIPTISTGVKAMLESVPYDAYTIRKEFKTYQALLPHPDELLQKQHSFHWLREKLQKSDVELPRFLKYNFEGGIKPHHALCCILLNEYQEQLRLNTQAGYTAETSSRCVYTSLVKLLSFGLLHPQLNNPASFIRDQFRRVAHAVPTEVVKPPVLRKKIKNRGLPIPNYFLDPENGKQLPPHIALLVILQDGEKESRKLDSILYKLAFSLFALVALLLRIVLEVIGGAGAIWGGAEVCTLRNPENAELWRGISVAVGVLCFLRFVTLNIPQKEDEGDILGPAGPLSLRLPVRMRAVASHPFHYFVRATPVS